MKNHEQWLTAIKELSVGKALPKALYIHRHALTQEAPGLSEFIEQQANCAGLNGDDWNIARLHKDIFKVTLLNYPGFYEDAYPALHSSTGIDLENCKSKTSDFSRSKNPPILHRKEHMVLSSDPDYGDFCEITREGEDAGLYENTRIIGFKQGWETLIREKGYELVDGRLFRQAAFETGTNEAAWETGSEGGCERGSPHHKVDRHRTALSRDAMSAPMKTLAKNGYLEGQFSVFDYGCGHGV